MRGKVFMNGEIMAPEAARISVFDRGFLYGDSVFETVRVYQCVPFKLQEHLARLVASGERVGFILPWPRAAIATAIEQTVLESGLRDVYVRIIATRGSGPLGLDPALAVDPSLIVLALELPPLSAAMYERGRTAWLVSVLRHAKRTVDPLAKTGNYLNSVLAVQEASGHGAEEAIMLDGQGRVAEASSANVFARIDGVWCTPPLDVGILSGITRLTVLDLCREHHIAAEERVLWPRDLARAEEIFLCASVREIVPVVQLDGKPVGQGQVGEATRAMLSLYRAEVQARTAARAPEALS